MVRATWPTLTLAQSWTESKESFLLSHTNGFCFIFLLGPEALDSKACTVKPEP